MAGPATFWGASIFFSCFFFFLVTPTADGGGGPGRGGGAGSDGPTVRRGASLGGDRMQLERRGAARLTSTLCRRSLDRSCAITASRRRYGGAPRRHRSVGAFSFRFFFSSRLFRFVLVPLKGRTTWSSRCYRVFSGRPSGRQGGSMGLDFDGSSGRPGSIFLKGVFFDRTGVGTPATFVASFCGVGVCIRFLPDWQWP